MIFTRLYFLSGVERRKCIKRRKCRKKSAEKKRHLPQLRSQRERERERLKCGIKIVSVWITQALK